MRSVDTPPNASILIESMRDIGYSLETALADVVDNSISAGARTVHIHADTVGTDPCIGIVDDGRGMSPDELLSAMRLGSRSPLERRPIRDLGRFGLGMKTASFSQCRRLTVVSRRAGVTTSAIWDLDHVAHEGTWALQIQDEPVAVPFIDRLGNEGVLVVWEHMDRAVEHEGSAEGRRHFVRRIDEAHDHLELVFNRYLSGESGAARLKILINNLPLKPFDPFHATHPATMRGQTENVQVGSHVVEITTFTLPHHRNVTAEEWNRYGGSAGYVKNQGFYLYREKRLIVHGTWFGLARQTELTKLTRVRIDMPNGLDSQWQVDVKKAFARPPLQVRERLQRIIQELGAPSRRIYTQRGTRLHDSRVGVWQRHQADNRIVYALNPDNPVLSTFRSALSDSLRLEFDQVLRVISAGLPMDSIFADLAGSPEQVKPEALDDATLESLFSITWSTLSTGRIPEAGILEMLRSVEPFRSNWDRTEALIDRITRTTKP
jgi:hypothetical protein